tara:strand:+ start:3207 stop:3494 length:288 start_codon:yes stop_codon:yes gene_type:complete
MRDKIESIKPFMSLLLIISSMLTIVFCKMEVRRIGYLFWKQTKVEKKVKDDLRIRSLELATLTRPDRVEKFAKEYWALNKPENQQIIQLTYNDHQ